MASQIKSEFPPAVNDESGPESDQEDVNEEEGEDQLPTDNVSRILQQLQSSGALIKKPKKEFHCFTCSLDYPSWEKLEVHLLRHVSLPLLILDKLPSDDEVDTDDDWPDEEKAAPTVTTPKKIEVSQLLKNPGLQIKSPVKTDSATALNKLSGLGFTIKKNNTPIKEEKTDTPNDLMQKLGQLGGLKLKLKSDNANKNSFKVVNGLKDFKTSDDEDSGDERHFDDEDKSGDEQTSRKNSESDDSDTPIAAVKSQAQVPAPKVLAKEEPEKAPQPEAGPVVRRPAVKQTPKRGANLPTGIKVREMPPNPSQKTPEPTNSINSNNSTMENVTVKKELETDSQTQPAVPLFSGQVKTERSSPPIEEIITPVTPMTPIISKVKTETEPEQPLMQSLFSQNTTPLLPVTKTEASLAVIEINGDSNDEDDDCCVVSTTPAPDVKPPIVPKTEVIPPPSYSMPPSYSNTTPGYKSPAEPLPPRLHPAMPSTEKQHSFNWNAPDSKPPIDMLEKSADDIFESLLSAGTKKENMTIGESEYISIDRLGSQYSCDVCNMRFTNSALFDDHIRQTGHVKSIITPTSSLMPYQPSNSMMGQSSNSILASLLPVKHIAEQVGKIGTMSTLGSGPGAFTHQQNVMINIQAYPGGGGMMPPPPPQYGNSYNAPGYQQQPNMNNMGGMYGSGAGGAGGQYPGQYPGQQQGYGQQQYGQAPQGMYQQGPPASQYGPSPLQNMQQAVYAQPPMTSQAPQMGSMGPPLFVPSSSSGAMRPPMPPPSTSGIRIQNVQTFPPPGGSSPGGLGPMPGQPVRLAPRPKMPVTVRGARPSIRPGVQVRGGKAVGAGPRMPMKRPAAPGGPGTPQKRRPDMLLPGRHDNEDCQVMAMQKQREGLPLIHSVQGAKDKLGSQISITKKPPVNREANAMANVLASRGISIKQKAKSRSPSPERPVPHIPNLPAGMSIKATSKTSSFSIPEAKVGGGGQPCRYCRKMFMSQSSLAMHISSAHPQSSKIPVFKCDECPASYPKSLQLQHHKRVFHNVTGPNRELGLPVVDLSQEDNLQRLANLGIYSFIPLANREQASGCFGIPVISVHNAQNGMTNSLQALGADGLLSLGPLKPLPNT